MALPPAASLPVLAVLLLAPAPVEAAFHQWDVVEVFSNADGSIQYVELFSPAAGEEFVGDQVITATSTTGGQDTVNVFSFPADLDPGDGSTQNERFLIATPGFANLGGAVQPDFVLPCGPFFDPGADSVEIDFAGYDVVSFNAGEIPVDGARSIDDNGVTSANSPEAFQSDPGSLALTACQVSGACDACEDADFCNGAEVCSGSVCTGGGDPCPGRMCDEGGDACVDCLVASDCDDGNPCTDDGCSGGSCVWDDNTDPCDDGLFCTETDVCDQGTCTGQGDPCPGQNCLEGTDTCGDCTGNDDCDDGNPCTVDTCDGNSCQRANASDGTACPDDGLFCNGAESCASGVCTGAGDPCASAEVCDETADACMVPADPDPDPDPDADAGAPVDAGGPSSSTPDSGAGQDAATGDAGQGPSGGSSGASAGEPGAAGTAGDPGSAGAAGVDAGDGSAADDASGDGDDGCGCRTASGPAMAGNGLLALLALAFLRRRRS